MNKKRAAAWRNLAFVLLAVYLPRLHAIRVRRRLGKLASLHADGT
jgi:hypothetical protein